VEQKTRRLYFLGRYVPMAGIQFGRIVSFSLTKHIWELLVTSEVERKMTLMGHQTSNVIYYQLQGHLTIILMYCSASLFLKERMLRSFGMNCWSPIWNEPRTGSGICNS